MNSQSEPDTGFFDVNPKSELTLLVSMAHSAAMTHKKRREAFSK